MCARASRVLVGGLFLFACAACGGSDHGGERFALYHLEAAIGPPKSQGELRCGPPRPICPGVLRQPPEVEVRYGVLAQAGVEDDVIDRALVRADGNVVSIPFTSAGTEDFARLSKEVARTGGRDQGWHHVAVVVGDEIVAFPEIDFDVYPDGMPDAPGIQFVTASDADARDLVERLRGG